MKDTKEMRKQFADAIMDGRFDDILEDYVKPEEMIERPDRLRIAAAMIENAIEGKQRTGYLKEYSHDYGALQPLTLSEVWEIQQGACRLTIELKEVRKEW